MLTTGGCGNRARVTLYAVAMLALCLWTAGTANAQEQCTARPRWIAVTVVTALFLSSDGTSTDTFPLASGRRGLSSRRACAVLSVARSTLGYQSRLQQRDAPALAVMRELAGQYPRYGYRKIRIFLARRGHPMSAERTYRLWRQTGLQVMQRAAR